MSLDELIARLEAASEGSRELDAAMFVAVNPGAIEEGGRVGFTGAGDMREPPASSRSLDAAMGLVPEGCVYLIREGHPDLPDGSGCTLHFANVRPVADPRNDYRAYGNTPILALCIVALKALRARVQP